MKSQQQSKLRQNAVAGGAAALGVSRPFSEGRGRGEQQAVGTDWQTWGQTGRRGPLLVVVLTCGQKHHCHASLSWELLKRFSNVFLTVLG